jgi:repressor LexA
MADTMGARIRQLRQRLGISQRELARRAGVSENYIQFVESERRTRLSVASASKIASALDVDLETLVSGTVGEGKEPGRRSVQSVLSELEGYLTVSVPVKGSVFGGEPFYSEEDDLGTIEVPRSMLVDVKRPIALTVVGNSLSPEGIRDGDFIVVNPDAPVVSGKLYVFRTQDDLAARKLVQDGARLQLVSPSNGDAINADGVEFIGRIVLSGRWAEH